jgi:acetyl-CoA carboxylase biotin carboxyl carrier protein
VSDYPEVELVGRLLALAARYGLQELEAEEAGLRVSLRAQPPPAAEEASAGPGEAYLWRPPLWDEPAKPSRPETAHPVIAPLTGTFYRAQSPTDPPFVEVGSAVEEGQKVGLIEAMKVYSEIVADRAGVVVEIVAQNGKLVQHGDALIYIDPT